MSFHQSSMHSNGSIPLRSSSFGGQGQGSLGRRSLDVGGSPRAPSKPIMTLKNWYHLAFTLMISALFGAHSTARATEACAAYNTSAFNEFYERTLPCSNGLFHFGGPAHIDQYLIVDGDSTFNGNITVTSNKTLFVNEIDPVSPAITTCFSGNVGIPPGQKLLVNEINPINSNCVEDDTGTTEFSGNIKVDGNAVFVGNVTMNNLTFTSTLSFNNNVTITPGHTLFVDEIDPASDFDTCATTSFSGNVDIKTYHVFGQRDNVQVSDVTGGSSVLFIQPGGNVAVYVRLVFIGSGSTFILGQADDVVYRGEFALYPVANNGVISTNGTIRVIGGVESTVHSALLVVSVINVQSPAESCGSGFNIHLQGTMGSGTYTGKLYYEVITPNLVTVCSPC